MGRGTILIKFLPVIMVVGYGVELFDYKVSFMKGIFAPYVFDNSAANTDNMQSAFLLNCLCRLIYCIPSDVLYA